MDLTDDFHMIWAAYQGTSFPGGFHGPKYGGFEVRVLKNGTVLVNPPDPQPDAPISPYLIHGILMFVAWMVLGML